MQYKAKPDGLGGNDDCGQMSAWYIFSSLGFYPVSPGSDDYWIGSPSIINAKLNLENGKTFEIEAKNQSEKNVYIERIELNGKPFEGYKLKHEDIMKGGKLVFFMNYKLKK
nr:glycoside hydrolase family 92 protein [Chryseobacterium sp.]